MSRYPRIRCLVGVAIALLVSSISPAQAAQTVITSVVGDINQTTLFITGQNLCTSPAPQVLMFLPPGPAASPLPVQTFSATQITVPYPPGAQGIYLFAVQCGAVFTYYAAVLDPLTPGTPGPTGATGATGAPGANGSTGSTGAAGKDGVSTVYYNDALALVGGTGGYGTTVNSTAYGSISKSCAPAATTNPGSCDTTGYTGTFGGGMNQDFFVHISGDVFLNQTFTFNVMKNGAPTGITCTINGPHGEFSTCRDAIHSATFAGADVIALQIVRSGSNTNPLSLTITFALVASEKPVQLATAHITTGSVAFANTNVTQVTFAGAGAFLNATSYTCTFAMRDAGPNGNSVFGVIYNSGTSMTIRSPAPISQTVGYICVGN